MRKSDWSSTSRISGLRRSTIRLSHDDRIPRHMTFTEQLTSHAADRGAAARWLPALLLLFIGSGCAALIYEIVWFQLLQLSIGSSAVSLGVLLGIYMGGM